MTRVEIRAWLDEHGDVRVTARDSVTAGYCVAGVRAWYQRNDLPVRDSFRDGVSAEFAYSVNDPQADASIVAAIARQEKA